MSHTPVRDLARRLKISKSSAQRLRRDDPDYKELCVEYDIAGVTMLDDASIERFLARKRERGEAAKQQTRVPRKRGRPPKLRIAAAHTAA